MEIILQQGLPHQQKAVDAVCAALEGVRISPPAQLYENPQIDLADPRLFDNLRALQNAIPAEYRSNAPVGDCLHMDVKMETGTGKTYVYTQTIFELHRRYGLNKFIIAVPILAIKAGAAQFLQDEYARRHFADGCGYGTELEVGVLEAPKNRKTGRRYFPGVVREFVKGSHQNTKKIHVLLVNMQLLTNTKRNGRDVGLLWREDYDSGAEGFYRPYDALRATRPVVILDEPHRFSRDQKAFQAITNEIRPQCIIRYGATFPEKVTGRGNNKTTVKDYQNLLYDLNACDAFHQGLIKGVMKEHLEPASAQEAEQVHSRSYQEQMLRLALQRHFETEKENFCGRTNKIKTLSLFFIEDISSYRPKPDAEEEPYLLKTFERLLKERIEATLETLTQRDAAYRAYLEASLADLPHCHGGYFSQDNNDNDPEYAEQVQKILRGKKDLLSFRKADGSYHLLRFLFSKWTLKEGWDNPNVFTIAKMRSSGSEISKLQEVGRGLRLPVDENGNRISNEEIRLNYLVDFTEADFARRLVEEINGELPQASVLTEQRLEAAAKKLGVSADDLYDELYGKKYIDRHMNIRPDTQAQFFEDYPIFRSGLAAGKVIDRNKVKPRPVKIRKAVYGELKEFWEKINQRYLLLYDAGLNAELEAVVLSLFETPGVFTDVVMTSRRDAVQSDGTQMTAVSGTGVQQVVTRPIPYGAFLKRIARETNLPIALLHKGMKAYAAVHGQMDPKYINENSVAAFCGEFQAWKVKNLQGRFRYVNSNSPCGATALSFADGTPREEIDQWRIGTKLEVGTPSDKYLYDACAYDSPLELANITADMEEVVVYGKIPRNSIAIPTVTGSLYSPDFLYVVKKPSGAKEVHLVVETKDVEDPSVLRENEAAKIACARAFFDALEQEGYTVHFREQRKDRQMAQIVSEVLTADP